MSTPKEPIDQPWFAVRCLFSHPTRKSDGETILYEERITLWRATSWQAAFALAEADAKMYAATQHCEFLRATDSFHLFEESIGQGAEVWSVMRGSNMDPEYYIGTFCNTDRDRKGDLEEPEAENP